MNDYFNVTAGVCEIVRSRLMGTDLVFPFIHIWGDEATKDVDMAWREIYIIFNELLDE